MIIDEEDILGYVVDESLVCTECATAEEVDEATSDDLITRDDVEKGNKAYFCDRCNSRIVLPGVQILAKHSEAKA
ncbi:hypothetical protein TRIP_E50153 [uncultured Spirochaetota bacterium]|jgi:uncharacterized protein YlaI|uniref:Uncharacterized protein n=1 Tax=uncultured Spirochaetota bacterium TaxID=460511 RepID=A0A653A0C8_9SPIR|nr:hypothetical protein TRIP_E50153 [uncultured Spirochaetota bacterium]